MKTTIIYFALIAVVVWFTYLQPLIAPIDVGFVSLELDTSNLFAPFMALLVLNYAAGLIRVLLIGDLVEPLSGVLRGAGLTSFIWLISASALAPWYLGQFGFTFFACSTLMQVRSHASPLLRKYNMPVLGIAVNAAVILGVTLLLSQAASAGNDLLESYGLIEAYVSGAGQGELLATFLTEFFARLNFIILLSGGISTAFAVMGVASTHSDPYVSYIGGTVGESLGRKYIYLFLFFSYLFVFRGLALDYVGLDPQVMTVAEWAVVCLVSYVGYRGIRRYVGESLTAPDEHGRWSVHVQEVERTTNVRLDNLSRLIREFTSEGRKEALVVHLVDLMRRYRVSVKDSSYVVSDLINFREHEPGLIAMVWRRKMLQQWNLNERREVVNTVMKKMNEVGMNMSYERDVETASVEDAPEIAPGGENPGP